MLEESLTRKPRAEASPGAAIRPTVMMPDGSSPVPLGSGVVKSLLGQGGMANVYEVWNAQLETSHAVKLINPQFSRDTYERFQTEIKISAKLHHPNITEIYGVGTWNGLPYIEMEKLDGVTLDRLLHQRGALDVEVCLAVGLAMARALHYAHNHTYVLYGKEYHGIIHRDLKPANIMVCFDGRVKLMDFGIARPTDASFHTIEGSVLGTLQYLSPEQLNGEALDERTDLYALGVTMYEMLTGVQAFPEMNVHRLMLDKSANRYRPLFEYLRPIPAPLRRCISRCMHHDPTRRVAGAHELIAELERIYREMTGLGPEEVVARCVNVHSCGPRVVVVHKRRLRLDLPGAAALAILVLAVTALLVTPHNRLFGLPGWIRAVLMKHRGDDVPPAGPVLPAPPAEQLPVRDVTPPHPPAPAALKSSPTSPVAQRTKPVVSPRPPALPGVATKAAAPAAASRPALGTPGEPPAETILARNANQDWNGVLDAWALLDATGRNDARLRMCQLRALSALQRTSDLHNAIAAVQIEDGEYYLLRARTALQRGDIERALRDLQTALKVPSAYLGYDKLKTEVHYTEAQCVTRRFDLDPGDQNWNDASGAWYRVKSMLRTDPQHRYYRQAEKELKRISEMYHASKG